MMMQLPDLADFGVSPTLGFLSDSHPLTQFPHDYYAPWDQLVSTLSSRIRARTLQDDVSALKILNTQFLGSELEWQRAYVALGFLIHGYIWSAVPLQDVIPPQLAEPYLTVCKHLDTEPVLSYAGLCLWNWRNNGSLNDLLQFQDIGSFTGTRDETAFYLVPVMIEAEGGPLISTFLEAVWAIEVQDDEIIICALNKCTNLLASMGDMLNTLYSTCDPQVFWHQIRPFLAGGKGAEGKGITRGFVFQRGNGTEECHQCAGGSAAQSSLFQFLDIVLGVEHKPLDSKMRESLHQEMRKYMPGSHRRFLRTMSRLPTIRQYLETRLASPFSMNKSHNSGTLKQLQEAYATTLMALKSWRNRHIAIVSTYIVRPSKAAETAATRRPTPAARDINGVEAERRLKRNGDGGSSDEDQATDQLYGTGGSALVPFLKQSRDETMIPLQGLGPEI